MRVRKLPPGTQEGLLQQALEKHAKVKRVEVFADIGEADVELENAAVSSKITIQLRPCTDDCCSLTRKQASFFFDPTQSCSMVQHWRSSQKPRVDLRQLGPSLLPRQMLGSSCRVRPSPGHAPAWAASSAGLSLVKPRLPPRQLRMLQRLLLMEVEERAKMISGRCCWAASEYTQWWWGGLGLQYISACLSVPVLDRDVHVLSACIAFLSIYVCVLGGLLRD